MPGNLVPDKAKLRVIGGQKAAVFKEMAERPKDEPWASSAFYFDESK